MAISRTSEGGMGTVGLLWRGDPISQAGEFGRSNRLRRTADALDAVGIVAQSVVYADSIVEDIRKQLLQLDGVLVWVDPISEDDEDRSRLDPLLREVAAEGVWVSTHPDVILKMGTKEVLFRTRDLGWGAETYLYRSASELAEQLPARLAVPAARVLKQHRGNGGYGVWKVEWPGTKPDASEKPDLDAIVHVLHAERGSVEEELPLRAFLERCAQYFHGTGCIVDQPFQARLPDGMIRCYVCQDEVVGYGHQLIRALMPTPPPGSPPEASEPGPRIMYGAAEPRFAALRTRMESEWIPALCSRVGIEHTSLPALWDADFLYGARTATGEDTFVLCEINVSSVFPFPDPALEKLARCALVRTLSSRRARQ